MLEVLKYGLLLDRLLDLTLRLERERVRFEERALAFGLHLHLVCLPEELRESRGVVLRRVRDFGILLWMREV